MYTHWECFPHLKFVAGTWTQPWSTEDSVLNSSVKQISLIHAPILVSPQQCLLLLLLFSHPVMSDSLQPHGLMHIRPPCPSPSTRICTSSCSVHCWCLSAISSFYALFSLCSWSIPESETFPVSHLFVSDDQNTRASASASLLPLSTQGWSPLRLNGFISMLFKGLSGVFSSTTIWRHQFFGFLPSLRSRFHNHIWPLGRPQHRNVCFSTQCLGLSPLSFQGTIVFWFHDCSHCPHDFGAQEEESCCYLYLFPFYLQTVMRPDVIQFSRVQLLCHVWLFAIPWTTSNQASLSIINSWSFLKLMSI